MAKSSGISVVAFVAGTRALWSTITYRRAVSGEGSDMKDTLAQNFAIKHEIGWRFQIDPDDLPAPKTGPIVTNRSLTVPFDGQTLQIPPGFTATPFAIGLSNPRRLLVLPNGDVVVAEQSQGYPRPRDLDRSPCRGPQQALWPDTQGRRDPGRRPGRHLARAARRRRPCAPAARCRRNAPTRCRPISASRCRAPMAPRC